MITDIDLDSLPAGLTLRFNFRNKAFKNGSHFELLQTHRSFLSPLINFSNKFKLNKKMLHKISLPVITIGETAR